MRVIGVTSGKGGVGKTTVSVNLAVELAKRGKKVVLLDGDLGLSNAQILLNARVEYSYGHVLSGQKTLEEIMVQSEYGVHVGAGFQRIICTRTVDPPATTGLDSRAVSTG